MITPSATSRLIGVQIFDDLIDGSFYEIRTPVPFRMVAHTTEITLRDGETLHQVAFQFYGDSQMWWALAEYNGIFDITTEVFAGRKVLVPPFTYIDDFLERPTQFR